jgi:hypothetical protein
MVEETKKKTKESRSQGQQNKRKETETLHKANLKKRNKSYQDR